MSQGDTFSTKIIAALSTPGGDEAVKVFQDLDKAARQFEGNAKQAAVDIANLVKAIRAGNGDVEQLKTLMMGMGESFKLLSNAQKTKGLFFTNQDISNILAVSKAITQASDAFKKLQTQRGINAGNLGLDSKSVKEASDALKTLQTNLNALNLALEKKPNNPGLQLQKTLIQNNIAEVNKLKAAMTSQVQLEKEQAQQQVSQQREQTATLRRESAERLRIKQKETADAIALDKKRDDARFRVSEARSEFYKTVPGANTAFTKFNIEQARNLSTQEPGFFPSKVAGLGRQDDSRYLRDAFAQNNTAFKSSAASVTDNEKVRAILQDIVKLEQQIIAARKLGNQNLEDEKKKLLEIGNLQRQAATQRRADSEAGAASKQAQHLLDRFTGASGGALFAIQAVLNVNQSIISGVRNAIGAAIGYSIDLEAAFKNLQAVTAITKTEMLGLEDQIKRVAGTTKFSALEVADAALILGQAGLSARQVAEAIKPVVDLATASGSTLAQAVDIVTSVVGVFNVTTGETADVANKITQAVNVSKLSIDKLSLGLQYAGNTASQLGISFEETTAALATMANAGIKSGSTMGTGLRQILVELQKPSDEFVQALASIGLSLTDLDLKTQSFSEVLRKLRDAGFSASEAIKSFDVRGAAAFNSLLANPEAFDKIVQGLNGTQAAVKANEIQMESLKNQGLRLQSSLGNLVSTGLAPTSQALSVLVGGLASAIQSLSEAKGSVEVFGTVLAGALGAAAAASLSFTLRGLLAVGPLLVGMGSSVPILASVGTGLVGLSTAATAAKVALGPLAVLLSASGIGASIAILTGLYFALSSAIETDAEKTEALTASLDKAKGVLSEKAEVVTSLSKKIEELEAKQEFYRNNTTALTTEVQNLSQKFGQWGVDLTNTGGNIDGLIGKLKGLRTELRDLQNLNLGVVASKAEALAGEKSRQAQAEFEGYRVTGMNRLTQSGASNLEPLLTGKYRGEFAKLLKSSGAGGEGLQNIQDLYRGAQSANSPSDISNLGGSSLLLTRLLTEAKSSGMNEGFINSLTRATEATNKLAEVTSSARGAKLEAQGATLGQAQGEALSKFLKSSNLENRINVGPNISQAARGALGQGASASELYQFSLKPFQESIKKLDDLKATIEKEQGLSGDVSNNEIKSYLKAQLAQQITSKKSQFRGQFEELTTAATPGLKLQDTLSANSYERSKRLYQSQQKGGKDVLSKQTELETKRNAELIEKDLRGIVDRSSPEAQAIVASRNAALEVTLETLRESAAQTAEKVANKALGLQAANLETQVKNKLKDAKLTKGSVIPSEGFESITKALDRGLALVEEARSLKLREVATKIKAGAAIEADRAAVNETFDNERESLINSFTSLYGEAAKKIYDVSASVKEARNKLATLKLNQDAAEFDNQNKSREIEIAGIAQPRPDTPERLRQANLQASTESLQSTRAMAVQTEDLITKVTTGLITLKALNEATKASIGGIEGKAENERSKQEVQDLKRLLQENDAQVKAIADSEGLVNTAVKERLDLMNKEYDLRKKIATDSKKGSTSTLEGASSQIGGAVTQYKANVEGIDANAILGENVLTQLGTLQSRFGSFFSDVTTGAKTSKEAFRDLGIGILKTLADIVAQQAAIMLVKGLLSAFGGGGGDTGGGTADAGVTAMPNMARHGGYITGGSVKGYAGGGSVTGGSVSGRDAVQALLMNGEYVLNKTATDAVGTDFLDNLNSQGNTVAASNTPATTVIQQKAAPTPVNVWVVSPDQQPVPGPRDIVAMVSDDIQRGGSIKTLIKSVQAGN